MAKIKEIFKSIQGEGPFVGYKQLFIRFCKCNLSCKYCDTDFSIADAKDYEVEELAKIINEARDCHSVSFTGGEPLLEKEFLKELFPQINVPIYLETNGTLYNELGEVIDYITYISADIKLPSCTCNKELWNEHESFFKIASKKTLFAKAVFDENITEFEIERMCNIAKKYNIELILQPMMRGKISTIDSAFMEKILDSCLNKYKRVRLIPQVHKFIDVI